jgi:hypothetical protein
VLSSTALRDPIRVLDARGYSRCDPYGPSSVSFRQQGVPSRAFFAMI